MRLPEGPLDTLEPILLSSRWFGGRGHTASKIESRPDSAIHVLFKDLLIELTRVESAGRARRAVARTASVPCDAGMLAEWSQNPRC